MKKTVVITGANSGIGKALVEDFIRNGDRVIMIARDSEKTANVFDEIKALDKGSNLELMTGDLSNPNDIKKIIETLKQPIDVLINNAGLLKLKKTMSIEDIEMTISVNYLSVFRLTMGLVQKGKKPKRIINITSELYKKGNINIKDMISPEKYSGQQMYANSKFANLLFSYELFENYQNDIEIVALHPGVVATSAFRDYPKFVAKLLNLFLEKPESASNKIFGVAISDNVKNGFYYNQNEAKRAIEDIIDVSQSAELFAFSKQYLLYTREG